MGTELGRLEQQEFAADWAEARSRLGEAATAADLQRTPAQRRHDALVRMARGRGNRRCRVRDRTESTRAALVSRDRGSAILVVKGGTRFPGVLALAARGVR